jgi:hypothetical protein
MSQALPSSDLVAEGGLSLPSGLMRAKAQEVQSLARARCGHVEHALDLVVGGVDVEPAQVVVGRILGLALAQDGCHHEGAVLARLPVEERPVGDARNALHARDDHGVELQPLRAMDGHHLHARLLAHVRRREELVEVILEQGGIDELARLVQLLQPVEERLRVLEVGLALDARRATERQPRRLDTLAQRPPCAPLDEGRERFARARRARRPIAAQSAHARRIREALPEGGIDLVLRGRQQRMHVGHRESAPGRAQEREPRHAVREVRQGARDGHQVLDHRPASQRLDIHRAETHVRGLEGGDHAIEVRAAAHEDRHGAGLGVPASRATHRPSNSCAASGSGPVIACHCTASPSSAGWWGLEAEYGTAPASASSTAGNTRAKVSLNQSTRADCDRKLVRRVSDSSLTDGSPWLRACMKSATSASRKR